MRFADQQALGIGERHEHGAVLDRERRCDWKLFWTVLEGCSEIVGAFIIRWKIAAQQSWFAPRLPISAAGEAPNEGHEEQHGTDIRRHRIAGNAEYVHRSEPAMHNG